TWREAIATYGCTWEQLIEDYFNRVPDVRVPDMTGSPVRTSPNLVSFRDWLREQMAGDRSRTFVNATGAGILHGRGIAQATLEDALGSAAPIGATVRDRLRAAHATSRSNAAPLLAAAAGLASNSDDRRFAPLVARWI